ncbi:hypothetical protein BDV93DRAFT_542496 [Ceratobasidium sp. AG-I]|nr:hypothetical protein BDV93DRAFT_542496 [Ceratobasidium sp. AG-I]
MVLGLSFRKKKAPAPAPVRASPSLPDIRAQSMAWPESLVDIPSYHQPTPPLPSGAIASKYGNPPSAYTRSPSVPAPGSGGRRASVSSRRTRAPAPFNLMVAGPRGVGKSALLRLLLQMADPQASLDNVSGSTRPTRSLITVTNELPGPERVLLTTVDTPGLDFSEGAELELEKSVTALVRHIDSQYAETLGEESKVIRQSKGDHHIHLCIYLIDPASIQSPSQRQRSSASTKLRPTRSFTAIRSDTPDNSSDEYDSDASEDAPAQHRLGVAPAELRAIQRLAKRTNVLPVIAHGDTLTDERLERIRRAVRRDLSRAVDMHVFGIGDENPERGRVDSRPMRPRDDDGSDEERKVIKIRSTRRPSRARADDADSPTSPSAGPGAGPTIDTQNMHVVPAVDDAILANLFPLVLIAPDTPKHKRDAKPNSTSSSSEARDVPPGLESEANGEGSPDMPGTPVAITTDDPDLPSAELAAGFGSRTASNTSTSNKGKNKDLPSMPSRSPSAYATPSALPPSSWRPVLGSPFQPGGTNEPRSSLDSPNGASGGGGGERTYVKGVFTRKYRWGTIDVLDPTHCDVGVLRGVVFGSHMKALKTHTREVMYERYRTEKLLARRATQNISAEQRSRLMKGLDP